MSTVAETAARFGVDAHTLEFIIAEAADYVAGGMDVDAAFFAAAQTHENMLLAARGYNHGAHATRVNKLIEVAGAVVYEKLTA